MGIVLCFRITVLKNYELNFFFKGRNANYEKDSKYYVSKKTGARNQKTKICHSVVVVVADGETKIEDFFML